MTEALVGRYMRNNQTKQIVAITAQKANLDADYVGYKTAKRQVWVRLDRVFGVFTSTPERLNGYTLLPAEYSPDAVDVA